MNLVNLFHNQRIASLNTSDPDATSKLRSGLDSQRRFVKLHFSMEGEDQCSHWAHNGRRQCGLSGNWLRLDRRQLFDHLLSDCPKVGYVLTLSFRLGIAPNVISLIEKGRSYRWIARDLTISKNTVGEIVKRQAS